MNKAIKAALLSAFVYPGVGHLFLKKYTSFAVFFCTASLPLYLIFGELFSKTEQLVDQIIQRDIPLDAFTLSQQLSSLIAGDNGQALSSKLYVLLFIWFISILDSYRLGRVVKI